MPTLTAQGFLLEPLLVEAGDPVAFEISHDRDRLFVVPVS